MNESFYLHQLFHCFEDVFLLFSMVSMHPVIPVVFHRFWLTCECSLICICFVDFIDSERAGRRAGMEWCTLTYFTRLDQKSPTEEEGLDASEQIAACPREWAREVEMWDMLQNRAFAEPSKKWCPFRTADGGKTYFPHVRKRWLAGWLAGLAGVGRGAGIVRR